MRTRTGLWTVWVVALLAAGCSGGGGGGSGGGVVDPPDPPPAGGADGTVSGQVTFDRVPHNMLTGGLDYAATTAAPVRGAVVEAIDAAGGSTVLASTETDANGNYSLDVPAETAVFVRVKAQALRIGSPAWNFMVVDNTGNDALYVLDGGAFDTGTEGVVRNLHAPSGWGGTSYTGPRAAAPFSILDAVYESFQLVLGAEPGAQFPPLEINWSPDNRPVSPFDPESGDIVTSSYVVRNGVGEIYLLGAADNDTDEYDRHVIAHEWGHYYENEFSRADSIGGPHGIGDYLDMRVAFGEGWGNAFSAMSLDDSVYRDALGNRQATGFSFDVENNDSAGNNEGWYSEFSVQAILYDLFDADNEGMDSLTLGFAPIHDVLTTAQRTSEVLTSIFSFIPALKDANPSLAANIDALVMGQGIDSVGMDELGSSETNDAGNPDILPIYQPIAIGAGSVNVCSLGGNENPPQDYGSINKLGNARFLHFTANAAGLYTFAAAGEPDTDPDLVLHQMGIIAVSDSAAGGLESFSRQLAAGDYVLEVYEFRNITDDPRGETCFDVSIN
ncbi:MAG TPA: hypothetical protein VM616_02940 [Gammaproteobacteria bacterium]|nr:hypothetical protein [Gammaproteobacteria bacterium]